MCHLIVYVIREGGEGLTIERASAAFSIVNTISSHEYGTFSYAQMSMNPALELERNLPVLLIRAEYRICSLTPIEQRPQEQYRRSVA